MVNFCCLFEFRGVVCDFCGYIYVMDNVNDVVYFFDYIGKFVRLLLIIVYEIYGFYLIVMDLKNNLWIGCRDVIVKVFYCIYF